jgi:hypothetical protein
MKKRNKKYNKYKNAEICTDYALKNTFIANISNIEGCMFINKKGELLHVDEMVFRAISEVKHYWGVYLAGLGIQPDGQIYTKGDAFVTKERFFQSDLTEFVKSRHEKLIKNFNTEQLTAAGWIASPVGGDLTEKEATEIFEKLGGFNA